MIKDIPYSGFSAVPSDYECADGSLALSMGVVPEDGSLRPLSQPLKLMQLADGAAVVFVHTTSNYTHYIIRNGNTITWKDANGISAKTRKKDDTLADGSSTGGSATGGGVGTGGGSSSSGSGATGSSSATGESSSGSETRNTGGSEETGGSTATSGDTTTSKADKSTLLTLDDNDTFYQINAIGNTLVVQSAAGIHYFLFVVDTGTYTDLGTHMPECPISFGLQGKVEISDDFAISFSEISFPAQDGSADFNDDDKATVSAAVLAKVNKFIAEKSTNAGRFLFPFLVRYAYRLYDGTLTMHSAPVLMICSSSVAPQVVWFPTSASTSIKTAKLCVVGIAHRLDYAVMTAQNSNILNDLKLWGDIIKSVDIFISLPIYTYDQSGECKGLSRFLPKEASGYSVCKLQATSLPQGYTGYCTHYQKYYFNEAYALAKAYIHNENDTSELRTSYTTSRLNLPAMSADKVKEKIRDTGTFYLLKSMAVDDLKTERTIIDIADDYLPSLATREVMTDDYDSHDTLAAKYSFTYNSRLNIAGLTKTLFCGFEFPALVCLTDGYTEVKLTTTSDGIQNIKLSNTDTPLIAATHQMFSFLRQDGKEIIVRGPAGFDLTTKQPLLYLYYPDTNCHKAVISDGNSRNIIIQMTPHATLNGSVFVGDFSDETLSNETTQPAIPAASDDATVELENKIYTSEVNNPFLFPLLGITTIGTGRILGISSASKALSEGQFGQFPLYAFTSSGVWALEVSASGTYSAKQPISRDVCISGESITQIDSAVLFATDRGIMLVSGSNVLCISDSLAAENPFTISSLPSADKFLKTFNTHTGSSLAIKDITLLPFKEFLASCRMLYDYPHRHIIVYNPTASYAYIYSLKSKQWGMMLSDIASGVNSYPEALAMTSAGCLVDYSYLYDAESTAAIPALIITRPFKLDTPDIFKTIDTIIQRGYVHKDHVAQVLYASNDLFSWHTVWSSADIYLRGFRGTPYKYFRLALLCNLSPDERLFSFTAQYYPRAVNQPR